MTSLKIILNGQLSALRVIASSTYSTRRLDCCFLEKKRGRRIDLRKMCRDSVDCPRCPRIEVCILQDESGEQHWRTLHDSTTNRDISSCEWEQFMEGVDSISNREKTLEGVLIALLELPILLEFLSNLEVGLVE